MDTKASAPLPQLAVRSFDGPLDRNIIETHIWAVREGLRGASAYDLFDGYCQRLVIHGVPLWRAHAAMETLHPQWSGYGYTWRRDLNAIQPEQYARSDLAGPEWLSSPMYDLIRRAHDGEDDPRRAIIQRERADKGRRTISRNSLPSASRATPRRAPAWSIRSPPIAAAASMTMT